MKLVSDFAPVGDVDGDKVDVVDDAVEVIPGAEADETAQREGETVVLRGEDELRFLDLLEARTVGLDVVLLALSMAMRLSAAACCIA